jgi:hypothetical protein
LIIVYFLTFQAAQKAEKEVKAAKLTPMPSNVFMWSVDDVVKWLETLSLAQYCAAFREATVDGPFLMELREEDLVQVLGVEHKLHVRKIIVSREKLKPLTAKQMAEKEQVEHEVPHNTPRVVIIYLLSCTHIVDIFVWLGPCGDSQKDGGGARHRHCVQSGKKRPSQETRRISQSRYVAIITSTPLSRVLITCVVIRFSYRH